MSFAATGWLACLGTMVAGFALTHPLELRAGRWWRIALSLPVVLVIAGAFHGRAVVSGYFGVWFMAVLAFIWMAPLAHFGSVLVSRAVYGDFNRATGIRADFAAAKALRKHGDLDDALAVTLGELEKAPLSYEGLLLLAEIYEAMENIPHAVDALTRLSKNGTLSISQRERVDERLRQLVERELVNQLNAR